MTTPRTRTLVSIAVTLTLTLAPAACFRGASRHAGDPPALTDRGSVALRFDNDAREYVHVYLIGARREWLLGRVEAGAVTRLRIPEESLVGSSEFMQLAVVTGGRVTMRAARDPRAMLTVAQPASAILSHQWKFVQGQLMPQRLPIVRDGARD
ncbi:MAG: hypothetical protein H7066_01595 [Cytophagaceae bacterium]|nr:hypothetical protein [Gemmatimonadaceae bacterium]